MAEKKDKQENENLRFYNQLKAVPDYALKTIQGGRLNGMSDINPLFRIKAMTEVFGPCGIGWKYEITKQWQETYGQEVKAFTNLNLYIKVDGEWSAPIPGTGGATIVELNSRGVYVNDEGFKMSQTDALGVAMRSLGVAADVYYSKDKQFFDSKYTQTEQNTQAMQGNTGSVNPAVLTEIQNATDLTALTAIWNKYPQYQKDSQFTGAMTARKDQIKNNGKK